MNRYKYILLLLLIFAVTSCTQRKQPQEQTARHEIFATPEKSGGVLYAYPCGDISSKTPAPDGYKPFYISYFGRHGSRYLVNDSEYKNILNIFMQADTAGVLTELGKETLQRLTAIWHLAEGNSGELTPLGARQMHDIAQRMYRQYPEVFTGDAPRVSAVSTIVGRCIHSMQLLCQRLSELQPELNVSWDADPRHMAYLNHHTEEAVRFRSAQDTWRTGYNQFRTKHVNSERLTNSMFTDMLPLGNIDADELMWQLFYVANSLQNKDTDISLYDLFESQELFDLWQCRNYSWYVQYANAAENGGIMMRNAMPLLQNIIDSANHFIRTRSAGATLRFGHDGNIVPLAMLLHLDGCYNSVSDPAEFYKAWNDFKVAPMGANIQIIFFRKDADDDILVKFLHNENEILIPPVNSDIAPYYRWENLLEFYEKLGRD